MCLYMIRSGNYYEEVGMITLHLMTLVYITSFIGDIFGPIDYPDCNEYHLKTDVTPDVKLDTIEIDWTH
jgi:hypothetical protein